MSEPEDKGALIPPLEGLGYLKRFTEARIGLGRAGTGLPTDAHLRFAADHARAKDAVYSRLDTAALAQGLADLGLEVATVESAAKNRDEYLRRPDLGRRLAEAGQAVLEALPASELVLVIADGLSAAAVEANLLPLVRALLPALRAADIETKAAVFVEQGRVAVGDPIGELLKARLTVMLIGERPGLSSADSMGCYLTFAPRPGTPDSRRNCISNIRRGGLLPEAAADQIAWLAREALRRQVSGTQLKLDARPAIDAAPDGR